MRIRRRAIQHLNMIMSIINQISYLKSMWIYSIHTIIAGGPSTICGRNSDPRGEIVSRVGHLGTGGKFSRAILQAKKPIFMGLNYRGT